MERLIVRKSRWVMVLSVAFSILTILPVCAIASDEGEILSGVGPTHLVPTFQTFTSATDRGTRITISNHGNVTSFTSPNIALAEYEHIAVDTIGEGYVLCYKDPSTGAGKTAYDVGFAEAGFGAAVTSVGPPPSVTRNTSDNVLELRQTYEFTGSSKMLQINMYVRNLTDKPVLGVILRRQVDFDVDSGGASGWALKYNYHARTTQDGVFAWNDPKDAPAGKEAHGMCLRHIARTQGSYSARVTSNVLDITCNPPSVGTPVCARANFGQTLRYNLGTIDPGKPVIVRVQYIRF